MIRDTEQQINDRKRRGESGTELQRLYRELETHKKRCRDSEEDMKKLQVLWRIPFSQFNESEVSMNLK